jgi:hypothetical protein
MKIKLGCCSNKNSSCGTTLDMVHGAHDRPQGGGILTHLFTSENPPFCNYSFNYCSTTNIVENYKNSCKLFFAIGKCFSQLQTSKVDKYKSKVSLQSKVFATCQYHINSHYLPFKLQNVLPI